jgi:hypothetical protein
MHFTLCKEQQLSQKQEIFRDCGVAQDPPVFQIGLSYCMHFFSLSVHFVCLSEVNAAQTFVSLRRLNHEHFERLNLHTLFYA